MKGINIYIICIIYINIYIICIKGINIYIICIKRINIYIICIKRINIYIICIECINIYIYIYIYIYIQVHSMHSWLIIAHILLNRLYYVHPLNNYWTCLFDPLSFSCRRLEKVNEETIKTHKDEISSYQQKVNKVFIEHLVLLISFRILENTIHKYSLICCRCRF